jgi:hypothetical protein
VENFCFVAGHKIKNKPQHFQSIDFCQANVGVAFILEAVPLRKDLIAHTVTFAQL